MCFSPPAPSQVESTLKGLYEDQVNESARSKEVTHPADQLKWHPMNRKQRRELTRKMQREEISLEVVHPGLRAPRRRLPVTTTR